jgi:hypothetical protein
MVEVPDCILEYGILPGIEHKVLSRVCLGLRPAFSHPRFSIRGLQLRFPIPVPASWVAAKLRRCRVVAAALMYRWQWRL